MSLYGLFRSLRVVREGTLWAATKDDADIVAEILKPVAGVSVSGVLKYVYDIPLEEGNCIRCWCDCSI